MATHAKHRRHGRVHELPKDVQEEVNNLLLEPDVTYDDIAGFLKGKGHDISRSSIGRYGKDFLNHVRRLRQIEDQSRTLVSEAGGETLVLEEAATKLFAEKIITALMDPGFNVKKLSYMLSDFARLQMASVRREALKADLKKRVDKAFKAVEKDVKKMSKAEMLKRIREEVYGIHQA